MYPPSLEAWIPVGDSKLSLQELADPLSAALPTSMNVQGTNDQAGFANLGWWGIDVQPQEYAGSFYVKGAYEGQFEASLQSATTGEVFATVKIPSQSVADKWTQHVFTLTPHVAARDVNNTFSLTFVASVSQETMSFKGSVR